MLPDQEFEIVPDQIEPGVKTVQIDGLSLETSFGSSVWVSKEVIQDAQGHPGFLLIFKSRSGKDSRIILSQEALECLFVCFTDVMVEAAERKEAKHVRDPLC